MEGHLRVPRLLAGYMEKLNGSSNVQPASSRALKSLPPKVPSQAMAYNTIPSDKQLDMPRPLSTNVLSEEQPSWLEDLLDEPDSPSTKGHRRSATAPFTFLDANGKPEELCPENIKCGPAWNLQMPHKLNGQPPSNRKPSLSHKQRDNSWRSYSASPSLPNGLGSPKEEAEFKALGLCCSPPEPERATFVGGEMQNQVDAAAYTSENSSGGSDCSLSQAKPTLPPRASKSDAKRKQHNARRSRIRKLQYIAELESNVQVLQVEGVEVSAQLEFLDQQNLLLGMENRALKQRLDNLSQQLFIKSLEQKILDRELARLQQLYQMQNLNHHQQQQQHKQIPPIDRRGRSCDFDSQFAKLSLNSPEAIAACNGFKDFPYRN